MEFLNILEESKTKPHAKSLLQNKSLSQEEISILKKILKTYWLDNQTEEQKRQMIFAAEVLLGRKEAALTTEDYAIIELVSEKEFFDEAWNSAVPV